MLSNKFMWSPFTSPKATDWSFIFLYYLNWYFSRYARGFVTLCKLNSLLLVCTTSLTSVWWASAVVRITLSQGVCMYICHQECTLGFQQNPAVNLSDKLRNWWRQARVCTPARVIQPNSLLQLCPKEWIRLEYVKPYCCQPPAFCRMLQPDKRPQQDYSYTLELDWVAQSCRM